MSQVTRRGIGWQKLVADGEDKSVEFSDGRHNCIAVHRAGLKWCGYVCTLHASICRTDIAVLRAEELQIRQYDPLGNLRKAGE
jgi:hypothetical protein